MLVAPWVAAEMTDLLQSAVLTGTGRAAQIGRPVAGKTGTTTSNKDGWFIGFSSGLTTGVWMGRDDARTGRRAAGRHRAGARIPRFHDGRGRPPPGRAVRDPGADARLAADPEEEMFGDSAVDQNGVAPLVDANGNPLRMHVAAAAGSPPPMVRPDGTGEPTQQELDQAFPPGTPMPQPQPRQPAAPAAAAQSSGHRPIRRSRGASRLRLAFAAARPLPYRCASSALNAGPWLRWTRWATSCATT